MALTSQELRDAVAFAYAAYGSGSKTVRQILDGLSVSSDWIVRTDFGGANPSGFYTNGNAAAIAAEKGNTLVIAFRGSDGNLLDDFDDAINDPQGHYARLQAFITDALSYASAHNMRVVVTGHSLGGSMAQLLAARAADGLEASGLAPSDFDIVTFGSPGLPKSLINSVSNTTALAAWGSRIINFGHTEDLVFNDAAHITTIGNLLDHEHLGTDYRIDLRTVDPVGAVVDLINGSGEQIVPFVRKPAVTASALLFSEVLTDTDQNPIEHYAENYLASIRAIVDAGRDLNLMTGRTVRLGDYGDDTIIISGISNDFILGLVGRDFLSGGGGNDVVDGGVDSDQLIAGGDGNDILYGSQGNDILRGDSGNDTIHGGTGVDTAVYDFVIADHFNISRSGNTVTISGKFATDQNLYGSDTLVDIELLRFFGETINVYTDPRVLDLSAGTAEGGLLSDGTTTTAGGGSNGNESTVVAVTATAGEIVNGSDVAENLRGGSGNDTIRGLGGDDVLTGYAGRDIFDGGPGSDTVDYAYQPASVSGTINLATDSAFFPGFYTETLTSIENVWMGAGNDTIVGDTGANDLRGGPGNDTLTGGLGNDFIFGDWKYKDDGGVDTAVLGYAFDSGYTVSGVASALHIVGADGDDWYYDVEVFQFAGGVTKLASELASGTGSSDATPVGIASDSKVTSVIKESEVAALGDDKYLVVWSTNKTPGLFIPDYRVYGQIVGAGGSAIGGEFLISQGLASVQWEPSVATLNDGRAVVTWHSFFSDTEVRGQILNPDGTNSGAQFVVNQTTTGTQRDPEIGILTGGGFVVTWSSSAAGTSDIVGQIYLSNGTRSGNEFQINSFDAGSQTLSDVAGLSDGGFVAIWISDAQDGSLAGVFGQRFSSSGGKTGGEFQVNTYVTSNQDGANVAALVGGGFAVTWQSDRPDGFRDVYCKVFDSSGLTVGPEFLVNTYTSGNQQLPSITALEDGGFLIVWQSDGQDGSGWGIYGQRFDDVGNALGSEFHVGSGTAGSQSTPSVALVRSGIVVVTWTDVDGIREQRFTIPEINSAPLARDDTFVVPEDAPVTGNLFADNDEGLDTDPDGDLISVVSAEGKIANVGSPSALASGAVVTINPDGRFAYDPNGAFENLESGQVASDSFTYTISDRQSHTSTATVTLAIQGAQDGIQITGGAGVVTGTSAEDQLSAGAGNDTLSGGGGYDWLQGGGGTDTLDGGDGSDWLEGQDDDDVLLGGAGADVLDGGAGNDLASYANSSSGVIVDLEVPSKNTGHAVGDRYISIEGLEGSGFADTLRGNSAANVLRGGAGNDVMAGGLGDDSYIVDVAGDKITELINQGTDTAQSSSATYTLAVNVEKLVLLGSGNINGTGNAGSNTLVGNSGNNTLDGGGGNDLIEGRLGNDILRGGTGIDTVSYENAAGPVAINLALLTPQADGDGGNDTLSAFENIVGSAGNDTLTGTAGSNVIDGRGGADAMAGGAGNDTYVVDDTGDTVTELINQGTDTVMSSITFDLLTKGANVENLILTGSDPINGTGNALSNLITGNGGINTLDGGDGNDTLDGGGDADVLIGGSGNDTYIVDDLADAVTETGSDTSDRVRSSVTIALLASGVEFLDLIGTSAINGTGNALANTIAGNAAANTLDGGTGDGVVDKLIGGLGDDTYIVDVGDLVTEAASQGTDTVRSTLAAYTLGSNVENLVLLGSANIGGTGNTLNNVITGNDGDNTINGLGGIDTASYETAGVGVTVSLAVSGAQASGAGSDTLVLIENLTGSAQADTLTGNAGNNVLKGLGDIDFLFGGAGNDLLDGGTGADQMTGELGNDTYIVDDAGDVVIEAAAGGTDTAQSSLASYSLTANVENLILTGGGNIDGTGNSGANTLTGNPGNNTLDGGVDSLASIVDMLKGGLGDDIYIVRNANDKVTELTGQGTDTIKSEISYVLGLNLENLVLQGSGVIAGTGNTLNNTITGNAEANVLNGMTGNDSLDGGAGADTLIGGLGNDVLTGGADADIFLFNTALNGATNVDTITDFVVVDDTIQLENGIFTKLTVVGTLSATAFHTGTGAADAAHRIVYDDASGKLYYDPDGTGAAVQVQFASLDPGLTSLSNTDFVII